VNHIIWSVDCVEFSKNRNHSSQLSNIAAIANAAQPRLPAGTSAQVRRGDHSVQNIADIVPNLASSANESMRLRRFDISHHDIRVWSRNRGQGAHFAEGMPVVNAPDGGYWQFMVYHSHNDAFLFIQAFSMSSGAPNRMLTCECRSGAWSSWEHVIGLSVAHVALSANFANAYAFSVTKNGNIGILNIGGTIQTPTSEMFNIATLPVGFHAHQQIIGILHPMNFSAPVEIHVNGQNVSLITNRNAAGLNVRGHVVYPI